MTQAQTKTAQVRATHRYDAPPEKVFDAWLDPKVAGRFLFATPTGQMIKAEIDARVGGKFNFTDRRPGMGDVEHIGTYLEIDRPRRLVFDFAVPAYDPTKTVVTIEIAPSGSGSELTLTHDGVFESYVTQTQQGWGMILDGLAKALTS
jgi:uncharacterized protein YndB with AHSA1/START domain